MGFPGGSLGKESACNAGGVGDVGSIPGLLFSRLDLADSLQPQGL